MHRPLYLVVHLRKGIPWQDIPPANGREFVAEDIVFHFDRAYGIGSGYTSPSPARADHVSLPELYQLQPPTNTLQCSNGKRKTGR